MWNDSKASELCTRGFWLVWYRVYTCIFNTLRSRQNGRHFADDIFKRIFLNENIWILTKISLKFVPKGSINNIPALVQMMAWRRPGDKPLSWPMMVNLPMHICITQPQWVNVLGSQFISRSISPKYLQKTPLFGDSSLMTVRLGVNSWIEMLIYILIHWGRATHTCFSNLTIIGSDNGLSPGLCQAIIRTNASTCILVIGPIGTNFSEIVIKICILSFKETHWKILSQP